MPAARTCPACRTASPSRPGDPLCPACTRAAWQIVPNPLWPFDSPLAAMVGWSRAALSYYEHGQRGAVFDIRVLLGFTDAVAMPREALLPLVLGDAGEMGTEVDRRSFGGLAAGAALAAVLPEAAVPFRVTTSHVKYLQASLDGLWAREGAVGGGALLGPALRQWQLARQMLKHSSYTETVGRQLLAAAGYLADAAGWMGFDAANLPLARQVYAEALDLATSTGDPVLTAWVLQNFSRFCYEESRKASTGWNARNAARQALLLSDRAADEARYEPAPWLHVRIALRHADAASLTGNQAAFQSAITRARRELDRAPGIDVPRWLQGSEAGPDLITGRQARGLANLGDLARAETVYGELLARDLRAGRERAALSAQLAGVQLAQNARSDALATGRAVLQMVEGGVTSARTLNELRPVRAAAGKSGDEEFCARFDAAERALSAA